MSCERLGGGVGEEDAGGGTRCRTMTSKLCHELPATGALHSLITTWSATEGPFHFLPVTVFHSLVGAGGWRGYPTHPQLTMEHKVLAEGTSQCTLGLFFDYSEWLWLRVGPGRWRLPPSPGDEQAACPLCEFPWPASPAAVHWYVHSRPQAWQGSDSGFYHIWPSELWGCQPARVISFLCFDWLLDHSENGGIWEPVVEGSHWVKCKERLTLSWCFWSLSPYWARGQVLLAGVLIVWT